MRCNGWVARQTTQAFVLSGFPAAINERVMASIGAEDRPGLLRPDRWGRARREARERGIALGADVRDELRRWAERYGVAPPGPEGD